STAIICGIFCTSKRRIFAESPLASVHQATTLTFNTSTAYVISLRTISSKFSAVFGFVDMSQVFRRYG
ncbi:hypothetical protein EDB19DRAFT_1645034, partial [Suillus lakei]